MAKDALRFLGDDANPVDCTCDILNKEYAIQTYIQYMFDRTNSMFRYTGLPDTIPEPIFEYMLQIYGSVAIIEWEGNIYAMRAQFGGPPDPYYRPTQCVIANPGLGMSDTFKIINHLPPFARTQWDSMPPAIRFLNDSQIQGLLPMFARYAAQMAENDVSIRSAQINLRQQTVIVADTGVEYESAKEYMKSLEAGELAAIGKRPFLEGIKVERSTSGNTNMITQLLELQQYLKASWYNEIGLNSNFNMKSQYVSSEELNSTADIMLPLIDNMYQSRLSAVELINRHFGTSIAVEKNSAWEKKQQQADMSVDEQEEAMGIPPSIQIPVGVDQPSDSESTPTHDEEDPNIPDSPAQTDDQQDSDPAPDSSVESTVTPPVEVNVNVIVDSTVTDSTLEDQDGKEAGDDTEDDA